MRGLYFYRLILSSTVRAKQLRIPENFVKKIRDGLSTVATLIVPDDHVWHVGLKKAENRFWFQDGWQEFFYHYTLRVGYFLVFRYEGKSTFNVYIYNLGTSEINYESTGLSNRTQQTNHVNRNILFEEMEDEDPSEVLSSPNPCLTSDSLRNKFVHEVDDTQMSANNSSPSSLQNLFNGSKTKLKKSVDEMKLQSSGDDIGRTKKKGIKRRKLDSTEKDPSGQNEGEVRIRIRFYESASLRKRTVTAEERERAINAAKAFEPGNPFCRVVLRPSYLYKGCIMYLLSCFAEKNLCGISGLIKLEISDGRQWPVRCLYRGGRAKLSQGWYEFSMDNNLAEGDVCVFELMKGSEIVLLVTIFRVSDDVKLVNPTSTWQQSLSQSKLLN